MPDLGQEPGKLPAKKVCGQPCKIFSRVVGFLTETENWNIGKKEEFTNRVPYDGDKAVAKLKQETAQEAREQNDDT